MLDMAGGRIVAAIVGILVSISGADLLVTPSYPEFPLETPEPVFLSLLPVANFVPRAKPIVSEPF
jgi:hypothetical protein